jgi:phosphate transport system substrate-binding protein
MPHPLPSRRCRRSHAFRRAAGPAVILGTALAVLATVSSCTSTSSTPSSAATASGVAAAGVRISGAGSTFDEPFFHQAFAAYQQSHPGVAVSYAAVGSGTGITRFTAGQTGFGATDVPATSGDLAGARGGPAIQVPVDLGAAAVAYNVLSHGSAPLKLTGQVLAEIYLGQITRWNDPAIAALNPGAELPDAYINVVHRADGSGDTYIFSDFLSAVSPAWAAKVGKGLALHWPVGFGADGNAGVIKAINRIPDSIGYVEVSYTTGTAAAIAADAAGKPTVSPASFSIVNEPGAAAYPLSSYSWVMLSARQPSTQTGNALVALISWLTHTGQSYAAPLGYVPLPAAVQHEAAASLATVTGPGGAPLAS